MYTQAVDRYIDAGGHVARFAGNFWWQIRIEGGLKDKQICFKYTAHDEDPAYHDSDTETRRRLTSVWEDLIVHRPGVETFGLNGTRGTYASYSSFMNKPLKIECAAVIPMPPATKVILR